MNKKYLYLLIIIILTFFLTCCNNSSSQKNEEKPEKKKSNIIKLSKESITDLSITLDTVTEKRVNNDIVIPAKISADQDLEAHVGSFIKGRVNQVLVKVGDFVKKGDVLMYIEGLEIGEIKSNYIKAKAQFEYTNSNFKRQKALFDQKVISQKILSESQAEYEKSLAELEAVDKKVHSIGLNHTDVTDYFDTEENSTSHKKGVLPLRSPIDGIVEERNVVIGQAIDESNVAFKIINTTSLWIDGQVYDKDLDHISKGSFFNIYINDKKIQGKIIFIGNNIDEQTRTIKVRGEIKNQNNKLLPGMFCEMCIPNYEKGKQIVVPNESVVHEGNNFYIFIAKNDTTFEKRLIELGSKYKDGIEIKNGIRPGELFISKGTFLIKSELLKETFVEEE